MEIRVQGNWPMGVLRLPCHMTSYTWNGSDWIKLNSQFLYWWLVRATYVVDGLFFGHFFWKVVGTVCIHGNT